MRVCTGEVWTRPPSGLPWHCYLTDTTDSEMYSNKKPYLASSHELEYYELQTDQKFQQLCFAAFFAENEVQFIEETTVHANVMVRLIVLLIAKRLGC